MLSGFQVDRACQRGTVYAQIARRRSVYLTPTSASYEKSDSGILISTTLLKQFDQTLSPCVRVWLARLASGCTHSFLMMEKIIMASELICIIDNLKAR